MPVEGPLVLGNIGLDLHSLPLEASAAESATAHTFVQPVCGCAHFLAVDKDTVVLTAELVGDRRILLVD